MSRQLKGTPVASGVVNRFDSVTMILCGSPLAPLTSRKPSAPAPPDLLTTISGSFISLCLMTMPWIRRAIWSAPPPVPAGTTNSTGLVGSQAAWAAGAMRQQAPRRRRRRRRSTLCFWIGGIELTALSPLGIAPSRSWNACKSFHGRDVTTHARTNPWTKLLTMVNFAEFWSLSRVCPESRGDSAQRMSSDAVRTHEPAMLLSPAVQRRPGPALRPASGGCAARAGLLRLRDNRVPARDCSAMTPWQRALAVSMASTRKSAS